MEINKAKEQAEDLVVRLRELISALCRAMPTAEREAQREQLKVIGDSIMHLENKDVSVPEDLRKLKGKLEREIQEGEKYQMLLYFVREQLSQILTEIGDTVRKSPKNSVEQKQG
ncbi:MAG: hypothetical protein JRD47_04805 [Deltaproteobacteria bacterium]|nr:hypothetical protein [Deltaproteobacteria bacterium]MBW2264549.1 hypothetical protein [Deltaproteobacteria bacterium]MBW2601235.1 hypothetical protein [Deltaproteobacteria bacterium]OEU45994.1 MAG: hypothetical protein BBJ60_06055 [Desulfobacterales bacterium S7086C20]